YDRVLDALLRELQAVYGDRLVSVAVYGSVGRGTPRPGLDIDVLIVARDLPPDSFVRFQEQEPVRQRLETALRELNPGGHSVLLSPVLKTPEAVEHGSPLFLDMVDDARILFDRDGFFAGYLEGLRGRLRALGSRRVWVGDTWYWDLKPDLKPGEVFDWP
ncbi:MAG: nucleotidyltransferase domain-containing protein, partial [Candidatus Rokuibacteriota bacterium]